MKNKIVYGSILIVIALLLVGFCASPGGSASACDNVCATPNPLMPVCTNALTFDPAFRTNMTGVQTLTFGVKNLAGQNAATWNVDGSPKAGDSFTETFYPGDHTVVLILTNQYGSCRIPVSFHITPADETATPTPTMTPTPSVTPTPTATPPVLISTPAAPACNIQLGNVHDSNLNVFCGDDNNLTKNNNSVPSAVPTAVTTATSTPTMTPTPSVTPTPTATPPVVTTPTAPVIPPFTGFKAFFYSLLRGLETFFATWAGTFN